VPTLFLLYGPMDRNDEILWAELTKITDPLGVIIVEISVGKGKNGLNIRIIVDKEGGIQIGDLEHITRLLNDRLSVLEILDENDYSLQVSSPGIYREFKSKEEYGLFKSRKVKVILREPLDNMRDSVVTGILRGMEDDDVTIETGGRTVSIPFDKIVKTKLDG